MNLKYFNKLPLVLFLLLIGCSSQKVVENNNIQPPVVIVPPPAKIETLDNLDVQLSADLNKVWSSYFKEDFTDSRSMVIYVVTNRNLKKGNILGCSDDYFGVNSDKQVRNIACKINVPKNHTTGEIKSSSDSRDSSHEYFKVLSIKSLDSKNIVDQLKKSQRVPMVFVHGFNVKFQEAIFRASQIAYDLKYQGPIVLFSWPAGAGDSFLDDKLINRTYKSNSATAKDSILVFKDFLNNLYKNDIKINLLVHSMGHQVVLPALDQFANENKDSENKQMINELILNAPDFEIGKFQELSENLRFLSRRVTLYCSFNDNAMVASEVMNNTKRLGGCALVDNIDTINVSLVDAPAMGLVGLGHGYYSSRPILSDVFQVLLGIEAEKRLFIKKSEPNSTEKYYLRP